MSGYVIYEAIRRFQDPPEISTGPMLVVALLGLAVNLVTWALIRRGAEVSINVHGAYLEVLADTAGSVGVIVAALITIFAGLIGLFILPRPARLGRRALRVLIQAAPEEMDLDEVEGRLRSLEG